MARDLTSLKIDKNGPLLPKINFQWRRVRLGERIERPAYVKMCKVDNEPYRIRYFIWMIGEAGQKMVGNKI